MIVAMIEYKGLINFQRKTVENTKIDFKDVVNEYLSWCKKHGKEPEKPSSENNVSEHMMQKTVER
jgi:predicted HicB family RNase H-like nuclease